MEKPHGEADPEVVLVPGDHVVIETKNSVVSGTVVQALQHDIVGANDGRVYWAIQYVDEDTGETCTWFQKLDGGILLSSLHID